jgi:RHS repeat-associated protein
VSPMPNVPLPSAATQTISYCYDALNRITKKFYSSSPDCANGNPDVSYTYDLATLPGGAVHNPVGRLVQTTSFASTGNVTTIDSYDLMGRTEFETEYPNRSNSALFKQFSYTYNLDGSLKSITYPPSAAYPSGRVVTYTYNQAQRPISAADTTNTFATGAHYTAWGALSSVMNSGITTTDTYNTRMQPSELKAAVGGQPPILDLMYDFNSCNSNGGNNGNVCRLTNNKDGSRSQSFQYDLLNRLTQALTPNSANWGTNYAYDSWGNLLQKKPIPNYTDSDPQPAAGMSNVNVHNQVANWCYDAAGNVVGPNNPCSTYASSHTPYENVFDSENRLIQTSVGGVTSYYDYDADGQRVKKTGSTNTLYWYGAGGVLEETDLSGALKNEYIFFGGKRTARYSATNGYSFYFSDHLGSAAVVTDALGNIKEESDYYSFGGERIVTDLGIGNNYKFTDKERDSETGCDYFGARYYCNPIGRFITADWSAKPTTVPYANFGNPQSLNLYLYAKNNPTTFGDPDGHCETTCQIFKGIAIGTGKFLWNSSIPGMATHGMAQAYHDFKIGPAAAHAEHVAQGKALLTGVAALSGNFDAQMQVGMGVANTWHGMSTTDKASAITQGTLAVGTAVIGGGSGPSASARSLVGFSEGEAGMIGQSMKNLSAAGYDTSAFQQLVKSTDMPTGTWGMSLSTPPTGAALGDGAFTSQEMLDHTMEEELRHLGQDLSNQSFGQGDAAAAEAEVDANRKFPEPK